jgi:predicted tellurium resistance membrane protein TerC
MDAVFGMTPDMLLILAGLGVLLVVLLFIVKVVFKLTMNFVKIGCVGILIVLFIACMVMLGASG